MRKTDSREIDGRVIQLPMVDVHTVGAGGGSIGWRDSGGALRVGPRSAGAEPGARVLRARRRGADGHRRQPRPRLPGRRIRARRRDRARRRRGRARRSSALAARARARAARRPPRASSGSRTRRWSGRCAWSRSSAGVDPRGFALMPFGGAGPMHAAAIAEELGIERILCPRASGVLSALGLLASERRRDTARTVMLRGDELTAERIADEVGALRDSLADGARARRRRRSPTSSATAARRSSSRSTGGERPDPAELAEGFAAEHERRYGYRDPDAEVELVNVRLALVEPGPEPRPRAAADGGLERDAAPGAVRRRVARGRGPARRAAGGHRAPRARACSSCPRRPWCCRPAGGRGRRGGHRARGARAMSERPRPDLAAGAGRRAARRLRRDGRGADPLRALAEHQGAPRLLDGAVRRRAASW